MAALGLEWREAARADVLAIVDYISDDNPNAAQRLRRSPTPPHEDRIGSLSHRPLDNIPHYTYFTHCLH